MQVKANHIKDNTHIFKKNNFNIFYWNAVGIIRINNTQELPYWQLANVFSELYGTHYRKCCGHKNQQQPGTTLLTTS